MEKVKRYFFEVIVFHDGLPRIVSIEISIYQNVVNLDADSAHHLSSLPRGCWGDSLTKPPFKVTKPAGFRSLEICPVRSLDRWERSLRTRQKVKQAQWSYPWRHGKDMTTPWEFDRERWALKPKYIIIYIYTLYMHEVYGVFIYI